MSSLSCQEPKATEPEAVDAAEPQAEKEAISLLGAWRVPGLRFRNFWFQGLRFSNLGFRVEGWGIQDLGFRNLGCGFWVQEFRGFWVQELRVNGLGFRKNV